VRGTAFDYADRHPQPNNVCLIVEVAGSTLRYDCEVKDKLYAKANITDYLVIDIPHRQVHIFRDLTAIGYTSHLILMEPQTVSPLAFPGIVLLIASILPKIEAKRHRHEQFQIQTGFTSFQLKQQEPHTYPLREVLREMPCELRILAPTRCRGTASRR
jgi:Putative restriction endonuclease